jgi:hypothetical protein
MTSLLDLGPLTEEVVIRGRKITVHGLTAADLFKLFAQFPDIGQTMGALGGNAAALMTLVPELIAKVIVLAIRAPATEEQEAAAMAMAVPDQLAIVAAAQRLTMPDGLGPFVDQITKIAGPMPTIPSLAPVSTANSSREESSASLQTESPGMTRGRSPHAN